MPWLRESPETFAKQCSQTLYNTKKLYLWRTCCYDEELNYLDLPLLRVFTRHSDDHLFSVSSQEKMQLVLFTLTDI